MQNLKKAILHITVIGSLESYTFKQQVLSSGFVVVHGEKQ